MSTVRIALANLQLPSTRDESVVCAEDAIREAGRQNADIVCFSEAYVPGYRITDAIHAPPDAAFLDKAWESIAAAAGESDVGVVLGTERLVDDGVRISVLVIDRRGDIVGFQDKTQLDPSEEGIYTAGAGRRLFQAGELTFGVAICHEGFRYPETVRWAAARGAHVVFHPHLSLPEPGGCRPATYADPANSFHEKAILCRAAENTCYVATVNCAIADSATTSAIVAPDGTLVAYQPYGRDGLLIGDLDLTRATGFLAKRLKSF